MNITFSDGTTMDADEMFDLARRIDAQKTRRENQCFAEGCENDVRTDRDEVEFFCKHHDILAAREFVKEQRKGGYSPEVRQYRKELVYMTGERCSLAEAKLHYGIEQEQRAYARTMREEAG